MNAIEKTLKTVASKAEMHRIINELPEDCEALLLIHVPGTDTSSFVRLNMPDWGHVVYWLRFFEHAIFSGTAQGLHDDDED